MNYKSGACLILGGIGYFLGGDFLSGKSDSLVTDHKQKESKSIGLSVRDYSFSYWQNGMRKQKSDKSKDILHFETGFFGLSLDIAQLDQPKFGLLSDSLDYTGAMKANDQRLANLKDAELNIELEKDGKTYKAISCRAVQERLDGTGKIQSVRMWESGRYVQHYDIQGLEFKSADGEKLTTDSRLQIIAWPDSLALTAEVAPDVKYQTSAQQGVSGKAQCVVESPRLIKHSAGMENEKFTVETWVKVPEIFYKKSRGWILGKNGHERVESNFGFQLYGGQIRATMNIGGGKNKTTLMTDHHTVKPDKWHHLAMTYDGNTFSLYVDGKLKNSGVVGKKRVLGNGPLSIGKRADNFGEMAPVIVDELRFWNRPLSKNELLQHTRNPAVIRNKNGLTYENKFEDLGEIKTPVWNNASLRVQLKTSAQSWEKKQKFTGTWKSSDTKKVLLSCDFSNKKRLEPKITVDMRLNKLAPVTYREEFGCYVAKINRPKRDWRGGTNPLKNYDDIDITISSEGAGSIPFLLEMFHPASITGVCPILCDENGVPTGIPVQLSKNWHYKKMGSYVRAYTKLPVISGKQKYKLRFVYGFYGKIPSASHAQLSLVGWGGNGRWGQLAIGSWGETYCMDMDMSNVDVTVTDVRMLMARNGENGKKWNWTDAGWGGDWLGVSNPRGEKLLFSGLKTNYLAHGPCLTDVHYDGYYGAEREVDLKSTVRTLRTNDHARTFTTLKYTFDKKVKADGWLFKMGRTRHYVTPKIAYGNRDGLLKEHVIPDGLKEKTEFIKPLTLAGSGPWWVSFPGAYTDDSRDWGTGYRALIIRSFKAKVGGKEYRNPTVSFSAYLPTKKTKSNLDFLLNAPLGVTEFNPGDTVELDVEWITLPRKAEDYYGENPAFRKHLSENPSSWKTTYREAIGNDLKVTVDGGKLAHNYPIIINAEKEEITVAIKGGVGYVPMRFDGLKKAKDYALYQLINGKEIKLDQSVHGNDFWQTDYDVSKNRYSMTFNLPLDGLQQSQWVLRRMK